MARFTKSVDGKLRATFRIEVRLDEEAVDLLPDDWKNTVLNYAYHAIEEMTTEQAELRILATMPDTILVGYGHTSFYNEDFELLHEDDSQYNAIVSSRYRYTGETVHQHLDDGAIMPYYRHVKRGI